MGLFDRISRVVRANVNQLVKGSEDPEKVLQQAVLDMQEDLLSMRQAVAQAIATQKRTERQCEQAKRTAQDWYNRAELALQKGEEANAKTALTRRQSYLQTIQTLTPQITQQKQMVQQLKANMGHLEQKISEARTQKDMYIARARAAQSSVRLNNMISHGAPGGLSAFERMELRVLELETQAETTALASQDPLEQQFSQLEKQRNIDRQFLDLQAELKAKMLNRGQSTS